MKASAEGEVDDLVVDGRRRNDSLGITGALIFTGDHFAQVIEGPDAPLDELLRRILHDNRHHSIQYFEEPDVRTRLFGSWTLAYQGPSTYVDRRVRSLFVSDRAVQERMKAELLDLFHDFVTPL